MLREQAAVTKDCALRGERRPALLREETLADLFVEAARRTPDKPALSLLGSTQALSYRELDDRSSRVADALLANGIGPGDRVGVWMRRGLDLHVAILGILKARAAWVPLRSTADCER